MPRLRIVPLLAGAALLALGCGPQPIDWSELETLEQSIIGGTASGATDYPAVGVTLTTGEVDANTVAGMVCTGTLIAPDVVLTAAHCTDLTELVYGYRGTNIENYFSLSRDVTGFGPSTALPADAVRIRAMITHPDWDLDAFYNFISGLADFKDIAIAFLDEEITSVAPAVVLEADDAPTGIVVGAALEIVGYGQTHPTDPGSAGVKYQADSFINEVGSSEMQVGDVPPGDPGKCYGDSGGPSFITVDDGKLPRRRLAGVTSHVYDQTYCDRGGADTRVDIYRLWLNQAMAAGCFNGDRIPCGDETGLPEPQAAPSDGGVASDGGGDLDAGQGVDLYEDRGPVVMRDGSRSASQLPPEAPEEEGCGCRAQGDADVGAAAHVLALLLLGYRRRLRVADRQGP